MFFDENKFVKNSEENLKEKDWRRILMLLEFDNLLFERMYDSLDPGNFYQNIYLLEKHPFIENYKIGI